jgi:hypothetical protein
MWRKNRRVRSINFFKAPCNYYPNASWNIWRHLKVTVLKHVGGFQYSCKLCGLVRLWSSCKKNQGLIRRLSLTVHLSVYIYLLKLVLAWCKSHFAVGGDLSCYHASLVCNELWGWFHSTRMSRLFKCQHLRYSCNMLTGKGGVHRSSRGFN